MLQKLSKIGITSLIVFAFFFYTLPTQSYAFGPASKEIYEGIDVSVYQGDIDFSKVKQAGIEVVYIRTSEGFSYIDTKFERNYAKAKENGLKVGFYHYVTARSVEQAKRQARFFVSITANKSPDCKFAMDFETFGDLNKEEINEVGLAFLQEVEKLSKKEAILYSNAYTANQIWRGENTSYPLWIAQYEVESPQNNGTWKNWAGWQYSDVGRISGIRGNVDRDYFTKDVFLSDTSEIQPIEPPKEDEEDNEPEGTTSIIIKRGDTLNQLARKYHTTVQKLVELNKIANPNLIYAGNTLIVPKIKEEGTQETYTVQKGDTLSQIAQTYHTTVAQLAKDNHIQNIHKIYPGQKIKVQSNCQYDCGHRLYTVKRGDTLWGIARRYHTTIANIVRLNRISNPNLIYPGQMFRI